MLEMKFGIWNMDVKLGTWQDGGMTKDRKAPEGTKRRQKASEGAKRHQKAPEGSPHWSVDLSCKFFNFYYYLNWQ